jgi:hypothetical protein
MHPDQAPFSWMTDRLAITIDNTVPPNSQKDCAVLELILITFTDNGIIFDIGNDVCTGWLTDREGSKRVMYGSRAALEAVGATNIE